MQHYHTVDEIDKLSDKLIEIIKEHYTEPESSPATRYTPKKELLEKFYRNEAPEDGMGANEALAYFREEILKDSVKTWHPLFMNQMSAGTPYPAIIGDMLASMMNPTCATWEMTPVGTIIEKNVTQWMASILGMKPGSSGIFLPGGSLSNLLALTVARNRVLGRDVVFKGLKQAPQGVVLCSEASHYSVANAADLLGIGRDHLVKVKTNERNEMLPEDLAEKLAWCDSQGYVPFAVVVTMGITVTGGFDPLKDVLEICKGRKIHIHVDAAFGGGLAFSKAGPRIFEGIERADSVTWDAHKWMYVPLTCSVLLVPDARILKETFSSNANYLFHKQDEEHEEIEDLGHYTILCGKKFDALKVWFLWQSYGTKYFREIADSRLALTNEMYQFLVDDPDFEPSYEPVSPIICFKYRPERLKTAKLPDHYEDRMHRWMREEVKRRSLALFNITKLKAADHFRMILINPLTTMDHLRKLMTSLRRLGEEFIENNPF